MPPYLLVTSALLLSLAAASAASAASAEQAGYENTVFVANKSAYNPVVKVEPELINGWGVAIRPAGAGGHFWVTAKDVSYEYVGDVKRSSDTTLQALHQDTLKTVKLPVGGDDKFATGVVYIDSKENFVITQKIEGAEDITASAKFLFASDGGIISAWTERKKLDGTFDRSPVAEKVIDQSKEGAQFFGLAASSQYDRIYAANFGTEPGIKVFDGKFQPLALHFDTPFDTNKNGKVDAGEYAPFNIQQLKTPSGQNHLFVTYAMTKACPEEEIAKNTCKKGEIFAGEEDAKPGAGKLVEFTEEGKLVAVWKDHGKLNAPWGMAFAPANFGAFSGKLLVANFGDGTIAAFDSKTLAFSGMLKATKGKELVMEKIWGITFGNGASLGDSNALYYAAGPQDEKDGVFGTIRMVKKQ